ncbi:MAG: hypothetical protein QXX49_01100 [Candidatus Caldarchaeum sp.]
MMSAREYELATGNLLMGRFTWLVVYVPEGWTVKLGDAPVDVNYTTVVKETGWVLDGSSNYYVVNLVNGDVVELEVKCRKGVKQPNPSRDKLEIYRVNGHSADVFSRTVRRGIRRTPTTQLSLHIPCTETNRTIELTFTSQSSSGLEQLKTLIPSYRCH